LACSTRSRRRWQDGKCQDEKYQQTSDSGELDHGKTPEGKDVEELATYTPCARSKARISDAESELHRENRRIEGLTPIPLVSLQRLPFRDFTAEEFLGRTLTIGAGGCVSVFQGSSLTLGQMADACVYVGGGADVDSKAKPTR
jgi:hypothetical protein